MNQQNINLKEFPTYQTAKPIEKITGVKNIIAVMSGKGGVGKSTSTVHLAHHFMEMGLNVGILDADIYGPSIPLLTKLPLQKPVYDGEKMLPSFTNSGIAIQSIGFLVDEKQAAIWRGPMAVQAMLQLLTQTRWNEKGDLDLLLIDCPPGTGDIQLSLLQKVALIGAVIITTPQDVALLDVKKSMAMLEKMELPILGIIENMSGFCCPNCSHISPIFGEFGAEKLQNQENSTKITILGKVPLTLKTRQASDNGEISDEPVYSSIVHHLLDVFSKNLLVEQVEQVDNKNKSLSKAEALLQKIKVVKQ